MLLSASQQSLYASLEKPRRIIKYVLVYGASSSPGMMIDEKEFKLTAGQLITITSGQVHSIHTSSKVQGFTLEFRLDFFCKDDKDIKLIFHNGLLGFFAKK